MNNNNNRSIFRSSLLYILIFGAIVIFVGMFNGDQKGPIADISYTEFMQSLKSGEIKDLKMQYSNSVYTITGEYTNPKEQTTQEAKNQNGLSIFDNRTTKSTNFRTTVLPNDSTIKEINEAAQSKNTKVETLPESSTGVWISVLLQVVLPLGVLGFLLYTMFMSQGGQGGRNNPMNFGKSRATNQKKQNVKVRFSDVAGAEEEKQELVEVVEFLKDPRKFTALGARIPAGVLLEGPPGTGKTLLAKAVAGEANVPFFSISGSEFVEMFVGVGASRVRDLFENAKKNAPAIIFIDEIDAVGRQRGVGLGGGNDEREQTLNQLLIEMDGFEGNEGIIVIAATNRSDVLDPALLRPGRFDRKVLVGRPDVKGREAILKVHARNKPLAEDVDLKLVAQQTPGFVGDDLENVLNEAALVAARRNKSVIDASDIDEAEDRVIAGPSKKDKTVSQKEREMVAYHEAGHTIVGLVLSNARVVHKVTIVPRGRAGGYMIALPKEDQMLLSKEDMKEQLAGLMGGRVAEEIIFNVQTTGASNDFEQATQMARAMVTEYGMSEKLGPVQYEGNHAMFGAQTPQKSISERTAYEIDEEVRALLNEARNKAAEIIQSNRETHKLIAEALLKYETLDSTQIKSLYETGKMPESVEEESRALSYDEVKSKMAEEN